MIRAIELYSGAMLIGQMSGVPKNIRAKHIMAASFEPVIDQATGKPKGLTLKLSPYPPLADFLGDEIPISSDAVAFGPYKVDERYLKAYENAVKETRAKASGIITPGSGLVAPGAPSKLVKPH